MPYLGELEDIVQLISPGEHVLELGCGTGRLCRRLIELGAHVTGVDESAEMLSWLPPKVEAIQSRIESLDLQRRYDMVLLASHMINHADAEVRRAFVYCAWRHTRPAGRFIVKRHSAEWLESVKVGPVGESAGVAYHIENVSRSRGAIAIALRYVLGGQSWRHCFSVVSLSEVQVEDLLLEEGFADVQWHGRNRLWAVALGGDAIPAVKIAPFGRRTP